VKHGAYLNTNAASSASDLVDLGVAAEEGGWDGIFVSDSLLFGYPEPWTVLASIAAGTEQVRLGTWISPVALQQPWRLAHAVATVDQLSGGRVVLGAGLGTRQEFEMFGDPYNPRTLRHRYDEALEIIVGLWGDEPFSFSGEHFQLREARLGVRPIQRPRVPIIIAAWWPNTRAFRRAATWDGIMPYWPALLGGGVGPEGQQPTGATVQDELRELLDFYRSLDPSPDSEIVLPRERPSRSYTELCEALGATWLLTTYPLDADELRKGPGLPH